MHQFSVGIQRELPWKVVARGELRRQPQLRHAVGNWGGFNEPSAAFQAQCDVTQGGSRTLLRSAAAESVLQRAGLRGDDAVHQRDARRASSWPALPGVHRHHAEPSSNDGKMIYDSLQFVANKRWCKGVTLNANYTWVPRWTEDGTNNGDRHRRRVRRRRRLLKNAARTSRSASTASPRPACGSCRGAQPQGLRWATSSAAGRWRRCSCSSRASRGTCRATSTSRRASIPRTSRSNGKKEGQFIYGVKPCVGSYNATTGKYDLLSFSIAYGCTQPYFLIRADLSSAAPRCSATTSSAGRSTGRST